MKREFTFRVEFDGKPPGEQRARTAKGFFYTPPQTKKARKKIVIAAKAAGVEMIERGSPVAVEIYAYFPLLKSFSMKKRIAAINGLLYPVVKPDVDNILVLVLNALNKVAWYDDAQVVSVIKKKLYGHQGRLFVKISQLSTDEEREVSNG